MTKKEAIAAKLAWKQALAEGRVVRFNGDQSFRSFKTHEEAKQFAYEDLPLNHQGKRVEPEKWGPIYSKPPKPTRKLDVDRWPSNCASGQKGDFSAAKHRAKLKAEFDAGATADKRNWAAGNLTIDRPGFSGNIEAAYKAAMAAKARRLTIERAEERRQPKPHYVLRDGAWRLAA